MIHVVYCGNSKVASGMYIGMSSILKNTKESVTFHLVTMDLSEVDSRFTPITIKQTNRMISLLEKDYKEVNVKRYEINDIYRKNLSIDSATKSIYTPYTLLRLCLDILPLPKKVLYLDTDTVCNSDIGELYNIDINNYEAAAVKDHLGKIFLKYKNWNYFNAGVMLYNLDKIRETGLFSKARNFVLTKHTAFLDQDALNYHIKKKLIIDSKFNRQNGYKDTCVVQHFSKTIKWLPFFHTQNIKPWNVDQVHDVLKLHVYDDILNNYLENKSKIDYDGPDE